MDNISDLHGYSSPELVNLLGRQLRDYRLRHEMTQQELADKVGVSVRTLANFETGQSINITLTNFLLLLRGVGRLNAVRELLPELPVDLYQQKNIEKPAQRIKHRKK